jgi:hypothetical protein
MMIDIHDEHLEFLPTQDLSSSQVANAFDNWREMVGYCLTHLRLFEQKKLAEQFNEWATKNPELIESMSRWENQRSRREQYFLIATTERYRREGYHPTTYRCNVE